MNRSVAAVLIAVSFNLSQSAFADIQPYRPDWDQLEAESGDSSSGIVIAVGLLLSAAVLFAVILRRKSGTAKSGSPPTDLSDQAMPIHEKKNIAER